MTRPTHSRSRSPDKKIEDRNIFPPRVFLPADKNIDGKNMPPPFSCPAFSCQRLSLRAVNLLPFNVSLSTETPRL